MYSECAGSSSVMLQCCVRFIDGTPSSMSCAQAGEIKCVVYAEQKRKHLLNLRAFFTFNVLISHASGSPWKQDARMENAYVWWNRWTAFRFHFNLWRRVLYLDKIDYSESPHKEFPQAGSMLTDEQNQSEERISPIIVTVKWLAKNFKHKRTAMNLKSCTLGNRPLGSHVFSMYIIKLSCVYLLQ